MNYIEYIQKVARENHNKTLIVLIGPPGAGKTDFARKINEMYDIPIISSDVVRNDLYSKTKAPIDNEVLYSIVYYSINKALDENDVVIYDATNCYTKWRKRVLYQTRNFRDTAIGIVVDPGLVSCLQQNEVRMYNIPESVIEKMYVSLKKSPPTLNEGFDTILSYDAVNL